MGKKLLRVNSLDKKPAIEFEGIEGKKKIESSEENEIIDSVDWISLKRVRKDVNIDESIERKTKESRKVSDMTIETVDFVDHTTQLPETVIHHILSLLPSKKVVARTSILSKRWRRMWISYSGLEIDERKFEEKRAFWEFADESIRTHFKQIPALRKFTLRISSYDSELASHMDKWIGIAVENKITDLDLCVENEKKACYRLPESVLASKSITALRLSGCKWKDAKLSNLKRVCLRKLDVHKHNIENLMFSCPSIEDMRFVKCSGLRDLQVLSRELKRVEVFQCRGLKTIELVAPKLHTFSHCGKKSMLCKIKLAACNESLKVLTLDDYDMKDTLFCDQFSDLALEKLELSRCNSLRSITISGYHLKKLAIRECRRLDTVKFGTPNLRSFEYKGDKLFFSLLDPVRLEEAKIFIRPENDEQLFSRYRKMKKFITDFNFSKGLKLVVRSKMNVIIHEDLLETILPNPIVNGLSFEIFKSSTNLEELCDRELDQWRPEYLTIVSSPSSNFSTLVSDRIHKRDQNPSCCRYKTNNRCWRHFLEHDENLEVIRWIPWIGAFQPKVQQVTAFKLSWTARRNSGTPRE